MLEYKTLPYTLGNIQLLQSLGRDNWQLCTIYDGKMFLSRLIKKEINRKEIKETPEFNQFYLLYPKKKAPKEALKAWCKLSKEEQDKCMEVLPLHIMYWKFKYGKDVKRNKEVIKDDSFVPYPASWLNGGEYNNEGLEIEGKSFDELRHQQQVILKRRQEEKEREAQIESDRNEANDITACIARLKDRGLYREVLEKARELSPKDAIFATIEHVARKLVKENLQKYKKMVEIK